MGEFSVHSGLTEANSLQTIQWTGNLSGDFQNVGKDHRCLQVSMAKQQLNRTDVSARR